MAPKGGKEYLMRAHFGLPSVEAEDKEGKPPISVKFEIPYFTTSGIQVRGRPEGACSGTDRAGPPGSARRPCPALRRSCPGSAPRCAT